MKFYHLLFLIALLPNCNSCEENNIEACAKGCAQEICHDTYQNGIGSARCIQAGRMDHYNKQEGCICQHIIFSANSN